MTAVGWYLQPRRHPFATATSTLTSFHHVTVSLKRDRPIGRHELLSSHWKACGCPMEEKCNDCRTIKKEFMFVSRSLLVLKEGQILVVLSRAAKNMIFANRLLVVESVKLQPGMRILLRRVRNTDRTETTLEFDVKYQPSKESLYLRTEIVNHHDNQTIELSELSDHFVPTPGNQNCDLVPTISNHDAHDTASPESSFEQFLYHTQEESALATGRFRETIRDESQSSSLSDGTLGKPKCHLWNPDPDQESQCSRPHASGPLLHIISAQTKVDSGVQWSMDDTIIREYDSEGLLERAKLINGDSQSIVDEQETKKNSSIDHTSHRVLQQITIPYHLSTQSKGKSDIGSASSTPSQPLIPLPLTKTMPEFFLCMNSTLYKSKENDTDDEKTLLHDCLPPSHRSQRNCNIKDELDSSSSNEWIKYKMISQEQIITTAEKGNANKWAASPTAQTKRKNSSYESCSNGVTINKVYPSQHHVVCENDTCISMEMPRIVLLFLQLGRNMIAERIRILSRVASEKGAVIVDDYRGNPTPTHVVIDASVKSTSVAEVLGFRNPVQLAKDLAEQDIETVKPEWIGRPGSKWKEPTLLELWNGLVNIQVMKRKHPPSLDEETTNPSVKRNESMSDLQQLVGVAPENSNSRRNQALSNIFLGLSQALKNCPVDPFDGIKSMMFNMIAGRVLQLDFDIVDKPESLERFKAVKGLGSSALDIATEFLRTGRCRRLESYTTDPSKVCMSTFMGIWGVDKAKATSLKNEGYRTVDAVRAAIQEGKVVLEPRAKIGLDCYDDFNEKMTRAEVEMIGDIVMQTVRETLPDAEITIMGSYRRGKLALGDIDILIVDSKWIKETPSEFLGGLVTRLHFRGHMAHHLTDITGIRYDSSSSQRSLEHCLAIEKGSKSRKSSRCQSYMGVFNSPLVSGRRRRIDIKFYPYREKAYAQLYFTGSGFFNRSMRVWARRCKSMVLNDHGLFRPLDKAFKVTENDRLPIECSSEKEVFDILGLIYKEPDERTFFDAVLPKCAGHFLSAEIDLDEESLHHSHGWIE